MPTQAEIIPFRTLAREQIATKSDPQPSKIIPFRTLLAKQVAEKSSPKPSFQRSLFPYFDHPLVVLVNIETITGVQLLELVEQSNPLAVFDLRTSPRFDLEGMDRSIFFKVLQNIKAQYFDLAATHGIQSSGDPTLYPLTAAKLINEKIYLLSVHENFLVLLSRSQQVSNYIIVLQSLLNGFDVCPY